MDKQTLYKERLELINKALACEPTDRIPVIFAGVAAAPKLMGMPISKFVKEPDAALEVTLDYLDRLKGVDGINCPPATSITVALTGVWLTRILKPGVDLPDDALWQAAEKEVMKVEDYDLLISQGFEGLQNKILPQVIDMAEFQHYMGYMMENCKSHVDAYHDRGYEVLSMGLGTIPFEILCGGRSMSRFFMDLYRIPDKIQEAMEVLKPALLETALQACEISDVKRIWIGGWRSASAMLAPKIWDRFVWPYIHDMCWALDEKGITPILHWDQDWTRDLARLNELPAKKCVLNLDGMTDARKLKEVCGDNISMLGDIPSPLLSTGTPDDVYKYTRDLIRDFGKTGLLICPGCDAPINSKHENLQAMCDAAVEG